MNKNGKKLTIATIGTVLAITITIAGLIWAAASQNTRLDAVCEEAEKIDPIDRRVIILETRQTAIYEGVQRIEKKLDQIQQLPYTTLRKEQQK